MFSLLTLPPLPYIVFELLRYKQEDLTADNELTKEPESLDIIVMDVLPTQINYSFSGKNGYNVGVGDDNVTVVKGGQAPTKISLNGTFGQRVIRRGLTFMDGFRRLKEFERIFKLSQSVDITNDKPDAFNYIYGMNFYDFTHLEWQAVNLDNFNINKNAHTHSIIPSYSISFTGIGKLIQATPRDPLLRNLKFFVEVQAQLDKANADIDEFLKTNAVALAAEEVLADIETLEIAMDAVRLMSRQYGSIVSNLPAEYGTVLAGGVRDVYDTVFNFGDLIGI